MEKLLLEMIYCQKIKHYEDVERFVACTLMSVQQPAEDVSTWTREALTFLQQHQFLLQYKQEAKSKVSAALHESSAPSCPPAGVAPSASEQGEGGAALLAASPLGRATTLSGISPKDAVLVSRVEWHGAWRGVAAVVLCIVCGTVQTVQCRVPDL